MPGTAPQRRVITSLQNPRIKGLVRLRTRREREKERTFSVEGFRELRRALAWRSYILAVYCCPSLYLGDNEEHLLAQLDGGVEVFEVSAPVFHKISYRDRPEGLLAVLRQPPLTLSEIEVGPSPLVLVVESVEKPGNLGAMLRTAEAAGAEAVVVADPATDVFNPNTVRASLGSLFTLPLAVATAPQTRQWLRGRNITVIATTPRADRLCWETDLRGASALVIGAEQYGLSDLWLSTADHLVRIPMSGTVDSLNAGAAAAVVLFEARRQRSVG